MKDEVKQKIIAEILSCEICKKMLTFSMEQPLRCPGLSYDKKGKMITPDGSLWEDIVKKHEQKPLKEHQAYKEKNRAHLAVHLKEICETRT